MIAYCLIRADPVYRREVFVSGLAACGFEVRTAAPSKFAPGDALVIWSRYGAMHDLALRAEADGVPVIVAENSYIWTGGTSPHHMKVRPAYAMARSWHNDSTVIPEGRGDRWDALGIDVKPWRADCGHILICPNRTFGVPGRAMPPEWPGDVAARLRKLTKREVRVRPHPGNDPPRKPLAEDLAGAHCMIIWSSSAGVHALVAGVPVVCESPTWVCKDASWHRDHMQFIDEPRFGISDKRQQALERLAHGQFSVDEIASGEAFRSVLQREAVPC